jgi:hypothetical protein
LLAMCQFDTPNFIYYSYIAVFILTLLTAFSILYRDLKHPANRDAFIFILLIAFWILDDFAQWTIHSIELNLFFARISILFSFIFLFFLFFAYSFARKRINIAQKWVMAIPFVLMIPLAFTGYNARIFSASTCDFVEGPLIFYSYILNAVYAAWATKILIEKYQDLTTPRQLRSQIKILIWALWFAWIWIAVFEEIFRISMLNNMVFDISPYFIIGDLFFVSLIAFAIIKCDLFNFNTVPTGAFTYVLWTAIFVSILFFEVNMLFTLVAAIFYVILLLIFWKL